MLRLLSKGIGKNPETSLTVLDGASVVMYNSKIVYTTKISFFIVVTLMDCNALGQVPRLVRIKAPLHSQIVR